MRFFCTLFLVGFLQLGFSQSDDIFEHSITEKTTVEGKFKIYLDTLDKYLYRDIKIAEICLNKCEDIIEQREVLSDSIFFEYVIQKIYFQHSSGNPLGAYQTISKYQNSLDDLEIGDTQKNSFNYIRNFTYMEVGDLEAAQESIYKSIERAEKLKDTIILVRNYYTLGQLYSDEDKDEDAILCFEKILVIDSLIELRPSTLVLTRAEISECYQKLKQYEKALYNLEIAFEISKKNNLHILQTDILIRKGNVYLLKHKIETAIVIYETLENIRDQSEDRNIIKDIKKFQAKLFKSQKKYDLALGVYEDVFELIDSANVEESMYIHMNIHELYAAKNDFDSAYKSLLLFNEQKAKRDEDIRKQKTNYLKIKFDAEQKEKENELLSAKLSRNEAEKKTLYLWGMLFLLLVIGLIGGFYQRGRYNEKLENEVLNKTLHLEKSNKKLKEFNRSLSHDLREPLRNIVGFSQLAYKKDNDDQKIKEYLDYVVKSGKQLEHLINSMELNQRLDSFNKNDLELVSLKKLSSDTLSFIEKKYPNKKIQLLSNPDISLLAPLEILRLIYEIIIDNAVNHNDNTNVIIKVNYYLKDAMHNFEIEDNGIGIEKKYHTVIFEMFRRLNSKEVNRGAGMGLGIAQKLVNMIDGEISILKSKENIGSTFLISFPGVYDSK